MTITARTYGGAVNKRVTTSSYPSVLTTVGKKLVTVPLATIQNNMTIWAIDRNVSMEFKGGQVQNIDNKKNGFHEVRTST